MTETSVQRAVPRCMRFQQRTSALAPVASNPSRVSSGSLCVRRAPRCPESRARAGPDKMRWPVTHHRHAASTSVIRARGRPALPPPAGGVRRPPGPPRSLSPVPYPAQRCRAQVCRAQTHLGTADDTTGVRAGLVGVGRQSGDLHYRPSRPPGEQGRVVYLALIRAFARASSTWPGFVHRTVRATRQGSRVLPPHKDSLSLAGRFRPPLHPLVA